MKTLMAIFFIQQYGAIPRIVMLDTHTTDMKKAYHFACSNGHDPRTRIGYWLIRRNK